MTRFRAACATQAAAGCAVTPRTLIRRVAFSIMASTYGRAPVTVTVSKKSAAIKPLAWERRNVAQVVLVRSGAGSISASFRISQTVEAATLTPG